MDINEVRKANLEKVIKLNFKSKSEFARAINKSPSHVGNWLSDSSSGKRSIGEKSARYIEKQLRLEPMLLDDFEVDDSMFVLGQTSERKAGGFITKALNGFVESIKNLGNETERFRLSEEALGYVENTLNKAGYKIFPLPKNKSNLLPFSVVNGQMIFPDFLVYVEESKESFYIDIYKEKRLKVIEVNIKSKSKDVLFIPESDVFSVDILVKNHIHAFFW